LGKFEYVASAVEWDVGYRVYYSALLTPRHSIVRTLYFQVEDWKEDRDREDMEPYEVERIATILAVACMFLSALYTIFAVLLFLYFGNEENGSGFDEEAVAVKPLTTINNSDSRRETFITMQDR
jgi:hypothetical protein